jgi:hypothetical protein
VLFAVWALVGAVFSYGLLYAFTPYGLAILAALLLVAWCLPGRGVRRLPEIWGLLAGLGIFCVVISRIPDASAHWTVAGGALIAVALGAFAISGLTHWARG